MKIWSWIPFFIILDQFTKIWARQSLVDRVIPLFSDVRLQLAVNKGFAFSLPAPQILLITLAIAVSFFLLYWSQKRDRSLWDKWGALLIISGAIGNVIDRIVFQTVTDFLAFWSFPVFNIADVCVSCGVILLLLGELKFFKK